MVYVNLIQVLFLFSTIGLLIHNNTAGYIYIVRDPRDVAISWAKHANLSYDESINFMLDFNSCIEWAQAKSELPDNIKPRPFYLLGMSMFYLGLIMI